MSLMDAIQIGRQGLAVQRARMQVVASNIANISTTVTPEGGPYRRRQVVVQAQPLDSFESYFSNASRDPELAGVRASEITLDPTAFPLRYEPGHPQADERGYVAYPNVNAAIETVDMVNISRSYEANLSTIRTAREMIEQSIELLRV